MPATGHETQPSTTAQVEQRPHLRGWLHGLAAPVALLVAVGLARAAQPGAPRVSVVVFGTGLVGLFLVSGSYHVPAWPAGARRVLARADVAMIQLFIAATFTPVAVHALGGAWRTWSLVAAWTIAVAGAVVAASPVQGPRWLGTAAYVAFGSLALVPVLRVVGAIGWEGTGLILTGCVLYAAGAVIYARRRPNPWPRWFAFHEVFHTLVLVACAAHVVAIWKYVLPLA
jgi:hemolysin III